LASSLCQLLTLQVYICALFPYHQSFHHEDGGSKVLQNTGIIPQHYMMSQPRQYWIALEGCNILKKYNRYFINKCISVTNISETEYSINTELFM